MGCLCSSLSSLHPPITTKRAARASYFLFPISYSPISPPLPRRLLHRSRQGDSPTDGGPPTLAAGRRMTGEATAAQGHRQRDPQPPGIRATTGRRVRRRRFHRFHSPHAPRQFVHGSLLKRILRQVIPVHRRSVHREKPGGDTATTRHPTLNVTHYQCGHNRLAVPRREAAVNLGQRHLVDVILGVHDATSFRNCGQLPVALRPDHEGESGCRRRWGVGFRARRTGPRRALPAAPPRRRAGRRPLAARARGKHQNRSRQHSPPGAQTWDTEPVGYREVAKATHLPGR